MRDTSSSTDRAVLAARSIADGPEPGAGRRVPATHRPTRNAAVPGRRRCGRAVQLSHCRPGHLQGLGNVRAVSLVRLVSGPGGWCGSAPAGFLSAWCNPVMEIDELLRRQDQLQAEAATVRQDLGLDQRLSILGEVVPVGSAALGLMVWRDLDVTVVCHRLDAEVVAGAGALLAGHPRVREVRFIDDTGDWIVDPTYPEGLYLGLRCRSLVGEMWKVDIWCR
jgi:hypothetical protein